MLVAIAYLLLDVFPPIVAGALFFMTPVYFMTALWAAARHHVDKIALLAGIALGPLFYLIEPEFDVLWAGLIGGSLAYVGGKWAVRR